MLATPRRRPLARRRVHQLSEVVVALFERQGELAESLEAEWRELERGTSASSEVDRRLSAVEADLAYVANELLPRRRRRVAVLRQHVDTLRARAGEGEAQASRPGLRWRAIAYLGALAAVWLVLWQLALAVGFR